MQYLNTRIPEGRTVEGLEYGSHVTAPDRSWSGYHVRPADSDLPMMVARLTPATDEQEDSDAETVEAIEAEILERMTTAEHVVTAFGNDGQRWTHPVSGDTLAEFAEAQGARVERQEEGLDEATRFAFQDGSAIVAKGGGWDIEGAEPYSWEGAE
ncbi:hypothetical protein SAMN05660831_02484 [Thiohalospira halophila DSM 15071]|uniref:Uncharacterized protein n=1 Tax=Thiohalospira halophila DSM 15071 TaxID=1123397 RepID=A0A1I1VTD1_9GAMM|nr:hypothetical protein [Thiohalospira halophila]SFD86296.1 hypothetical protein SAMN05660831_02484 [Thiohalospira halophila DSM 15071]